MTKPTIAVICGPSCSGKSRLQEELKRLGYEVVVTHTTRDPRAGEIQGRSYNFVTVDEFASLLASDELLESERVGEHFYGTSRKAINDALAKTGLASLVMEPKGAAKVMAHYQGADIRVVRIWISCDPDEQALRFMRRYQDDLGAGRKRLSVMLGVEQDWIKQAAEGGQYHLYLRSDLDSPESLAYVSHKFMTRPRS